MESASDNPISHAFRPLLGLPAWGGMKGQGSMLSFELGKPHLTITEPRPSTSRSATVRQMAARRIVRPSGEWFFFIYACQWRALSDATPIADSDSEHVAIERAVRMLDGQRLRSVVVNPADGRCGFRFDLGGDLQTWPVDGENEEQWSLQRPDGQVLGFRADGTYSLAPANQPPEAETWLALPPGPITCGLE